MSLDNIIQYMVKSDQAIALIDKETGITEVRIKDNRPIDTNKYYISNFEAMQLNERIAKACKEDRQSRESHISILGRLSS